MIGETATTSLWRSRRQIREGLEDFFGIDGDEPIELWAWVGAYLAAAGVASLVGIGLAGDRKG